MLVPAWNSLSPAAPAAIGPAAIRTPIRHVVVIVQENHSFDSYFVAYRAQTHTCNTARDPYTPVQPVPLTSARTATYDPNHFADCERVEIHSGRMAGYIAPHAAQTQSTGYPCGSRWRTSPRPAPDRSHRRRPTSSGPALVPRWPTATLSLDPPQELV